MVVVRPSPIQGLGVFAAEAFRTGQRVLELDDSWVVDEEHPPKTYVPNRARRIVIKRIWHGWTKPENADRYERLLREEVFGEIASKGIEGYRGIELLRRDGTDEVEFVTIMSFDSLDAVRAFAGDDYERAYVPLRAREVLERFDERSRHYRVRETIGSGTP